MKKNNNNKGFALLYAVLLTSAVLIVGVTLINIITRQLILSSLNRNSQIAYYNANSIANCFRFYDKVNHFTALDFDSLSFTYVNNIDLQCAGGVVKEDLNFGGNEISDVSFEINGQVTTIADFILNLGYINFPDTYNSNNCFVPASGEGFSNSCISVITVNGSNTQIGSSNPRKVIRTAISIR
ncbi:MAG TPA: hypothetical protein PKN73_02570 [Candidatus Paceibacterota bacterium]|nr:hypothetical protein [Candidatus Paceibacterota bacterium]